MMENVQPMQPSPFAQLVDELRNKSDEELKLIYMRLFSDELKKEWKDITADANFDGVSDEDIVKALRKNRPSTNNIQDD